MSPGSRPPYLHLLPSGLRRDPANQGDGTVRSQYGPGGQATRWSRATPHRGRSGRQSAAVIPLTPQLPAFRPGSRASLGLFKSHLRSHLAPESSTTRPLTGRNPSSPTKLRILNQASRTPTGSALPTAPWRLPVTRRQGNACNSAAHVQAQAGPEKRAGTTSMAPRHGPSARTGPPPRYQLSLTLATRQSGKFCHSPAQHATRSGFVLESQRAGTLCKFPISGSSAIIQFPCTISADACISAATALLLPASA